MKRMILLLLFFAPPFFSSAQINQTYTNPILAGFYPDPSICKVGEDYYLVNSTFSYFPGITVFHSKDLVDWTLIGYVLDDPKQFNLDGQGVSRGIFAPAIRYHNGLFYVTCTLVDIGGNFVATAKNPAGPWSKPTWLPQINGIDPSLFFDDDGKAYIVYNSIPPDNKPLYPGHRTIRMYEFDPDSLKVEGTEKLLVNGGTDIRKKPVWIEAPHIFKVNGHYYLFDAEGGTAENHSEVVFKSDSVDGPYVPYEKNPILTQRQLDPNRPNPITCAGHADFVETDSGKWWAVFLGCRPYTSAEKDYYNTGRETFLAPVTWKDGWPIITSDDELVSYRYPFPLPVSKEPNEIPHSGNFLTRDDFNSESLNIEWMFLRTPHEQWYDLKRKGFLTIRLRPETCSGEMNPSFIGHRQEHLHGYASAGMVFTPAAENEKAGLVIFQNETHFYFLCKSLRDGRSVVELYTSNADSQVTLIHSENLTEDQANSEIYLKIQAEDSTYSFYYSLNPVRWNLLKDSVDASYLSTKIAGGFVGCTYAMYATSLGQPSNSSAAFDWFEYDGDDAVFK
jgi:xylan 1,4-beta-xylosidase